MPLARKRPEDRSQSYAPRRSVRLYLDEIEQISAVMSKACGPVYAETADFEGQLLTATELTQAGEEERSLVLRAMDGERKIHLGLGGGVSLRVTPSDDLGLMGAFQTIRETLDSRQRPFGGIPLHSRFYATWMATFTIAVSMVALSAPTLDVDRYGSSTLAMMAVSALVALVVGVGLVGRFGRNPTPGGIVVLAYRADAPTWWERNRSAVLVGTATNAIVGLAFFLLGLWVAA